MSSETELPDMTASDDGGARPSSGRLAGSGTASRVGAACSGLLAAAAALSTGELVSGFSRRVPSLVISVAEVFVDGTPGGVVRWSIRTFGTSQKTLLVWGVTVAALLVGAGIGLATRKSLAAGAVAFGAFAVVGGWAAARSPLSADGWSWVSAIVSGAVGIAVLWAMSRPLVGRSIVPGRATNGLPGSRTPVTAAAASSMATDPPMAVPMIPVIPGRPSRRGFLAAGGIALAWTAFGAGVGRHLRKVHNVEAAREEVATRLATETTTTTGATGPGGTGGASGTPSPSGPGTFTSFDGQVEGLSPLVTPNADFFRIDTALIVPQVDPASWRLRIHGMVERELSLTFDDLLALERIAEHITIQCVSNEVGGDLIGNALWTGVPLKTLLDMAGVAPGATQLVGRSVDGWTGGFPTEIALDGRPAMVALTMNGEPLPVIHGFPARLMVPGLYGYVSATKWLSEIELTTWEAFDGYWIPRGWSKEGPIKTQSRIDHPRTSRRPIPAGPTPVAGVAWAPTRGVARVEVRVDEEPWRMARLSGALSEHTWVQWIVEWDLVPGEHRITVRATDGDGVTQDEEERPPAPDGATGYHTVRVSVE
jgi:DMSO/TMAO reductase YedYZ molybdopterin-dependent catalytic subunit